MMTRFICLTTILAVGMVMLGCGGAGDFATAPSTGELSAADTVSAGRTQTHLWGYFDVYIDIESQTATAIENRQAMFTANVVNFINSKPAGLSFHINGTPVTPEYVDVDIDVSITHPFPGLHQYDGYDVRGVFMGDGSVSLNYNPDLVYPVLGTDQIMLADPLDGFGGPDGYTRWFNLTEFSEGGMPLFSYTQGKLASQGFAGTATLNAYKYFADGLQPNDEAFVWLDENAEGHGVFSAGATNTRNYYLRFPNGKGVKYGYAITANWGGAELQDHPSNAPEAVAAQVEDNSSVFYIDAGNNGGQVDLDFSLFNWGGQPSTIFVESTVLSSPHQLDPSEMTPIGGNENYSTWHVEIGADNVTGTLGNDYWIVAQYSELDYSNEFGTPNLAQNDPLTAYFRYDLEVSSNQTNQDPVCDIQVVTSTPVNGWDFGTPVEYDASGSTDPDGDPLTFEWDFDGDGDFGDSFDSGTDDNPTKLYMQDYVGDVCVRVSDGQGGVAECCVPVDITVWPSKNIPLRDGVDAYDIAINPNSGDLSVLYSDGQIWNSTDPGLYQTGAPFKDLATDFGSYQDLTGLNWLDIAPNNAIVITGQTAGGQNRLAFYLADGTPDPCSIYPGSSFAIFDAYAFGDGGTFANDAGYSFGYEWNGFHYTQIERHEDPEYCQTHFMSYIFFGSDYGGPEKIYAPYCVAVETDKNGDYMWFLENTDWYGSRWLATGTGIYGDLVYDNAYFGTGSQTNDDDGWYEAKDITRDNQNRLFVLDELVSGDARVKMWTVSGNTTTSKGGFGDNSTISGAPLRVEGGDYSGLIFVLHGSVASGFYLSIFSPIEMPS